MQDAISADAGYCSPRKASAEAPNHRVRLPSSCSSPNCNVLLSSCRKHRDPTGVPCARTARRPKTGIELGRRRVLSGVVLGERRGGGDLGSDLLQRRPRGVQSGTRGEQGADVPEGIKGRAMGDRDHSVASSAESSLSAIPSAARLISSAGVVPLLPLRSRRS
jgi:hypothetical protein